MRRALVATILLCLSALAADRPAAPEYFKYGRGVIDAKGQCYFVVDQTMWQTMRPDLGDMRLYSSGAEVPYALEVERGGRSLTQEPAKMLDLGEKAGGTEFKLQVSVAEYDSLTLKLKTKNFTTTATLEGSDDGREWRKLGTQSIFDFSDEHLGANFEIRLATPSRFPFLRISLPDRVPAKDVEGASVALLKDVQASWVSLPAESRITEKGSDTVVEWDSPEIPLEQVQVVIGEPALNFYRAAELFNAEGVNIASTELSRVHVKRNGRSIDHENLAIDVPYESRSKHYKLVIHNQSDRALHVEAVRPLSYERRVYFEAQPRAHMVLYFSDPKTEPPVYDFSRLFHRDPAAVRADLEPAIANVAYKGRPDDRPWTERNAWVMWTALVLAVVGLGAVALKGMKANA